MTDSLDELLDDLFLGCAVAAFVEQASIQRDWPCPEATRRRAYQLYEESLARKNQSGIRPDEASNDQIQGCPPE